MILNQYISEINTLYRLFSGGPMSLVGMYGSWTVQLYVDSLQFCGNCLIASDKIVAESCVSSQGFFVVAVQSYIVEFCRPSVRWVFPLWWTSQRLDLFSEPFQRTGCVLLCHRCHQVRKLFVVRKDPVRRN